jgi:hypothetical protein
MLLKVSDGDGGWVLLDNVEHAHLTAKVHTVKHQNELEAIGGPGALNLISKEALASGTNITVGVIEFVRNGTSRKALFTNIVYVCNDKGDTLDKLLVNRHQGGK